MLFFIQFSSDDEGLRRKQLASRYGQWLYGIIVLLSSDRDEHFWSFSTFNQIKKSCRADQETEELLWKCISGHFPCFPYDAEEVADMAKWFDMAMLTSINGLDGYPCQLVPLDDTAGDYFYFKFKVSLRTG